MGESQWPDGAVAWTDPAGSLGASPTLAPAQAGSGRLSAGTTGTSRTLKQLPDLADVRN